MVVKRIEEGCARWICELLLAGINGLIAQGTHFAAMQQKLPTLIRNFVGSPDVSRAMSRKLYHNALNAEQRVR
ncbi:hypothetical protein BRADO3841 [Bradyrhizobium sp. ORS 278]|nr:hypothetical protein BRADO3841 [Bradyrhizobium sp. ORS 278]